MFNQILYPKDRNIYHVTNEKKKCHVESGREEFFLKQKTLTVSCHSNPSIPVEY